MKTSPQLNMKQALFWLKLKLALTLVIILFLAQFLNFILKTDSYEELHIWGTFAKIAASGSSFIQNIDAKSEVVKDDTTEAIIPLQKELIQLKKNFPQIENILVADEKGIVRHALGNSEIPIGENWKNIISKDDTIKELFSDELSSGICVEADGNIYCLLQAKHFIESDTNSHEEDLLIFELENKSVDKYIQKLRLTRIIEAILLCIAAGIILFFLFKIIPIFKNNEILKFNLYFIIFVVYAAAQTFSLYVNSHTYDKTYISITKQIGGNVNSQIINVLQTLFDNNTLDRHKALIIKDINFLVEKCKEIESINLFDTQGNVLLTSLLDGTTPILDLNSDWQNNLSLFKSKNGEKLVEAYSNVTFDESYISNNIKKHFYNYLTISVVSLMIQAELIFLMVMIFLGNFHSFSPQEKDKSISYCQQVRFLAFLVVFTNSLSVTFIALYMEKIYQPFLGLSKTIVLSLPVSSEVCFVAIFTFIAGLLIKKFGWKVFFISGAAILAIGSLLSAYATLPFSFILSRGIVGAGLGFCFTSMGTFISMITTKDNKASGYSSYGMGVISGSICGGVIGALIVDKFGYKATFIFSALIFPLILAGFFIFKSKFNSPFKVKPEDIKRKRLSFSEMAAFIRHKRVYSLFISWFTTSAVVFGFIYYFMPIYLNQIGYNKSDIGRVNLLFGLSIILFMQYIARLVDKSISLKLYIIVAGLLGLGGLICFLIIPGIGAIIFSVLLLGLASMLSKNSHYAYYMNSKEVKNIGDAPALGIYSMLFSVGQMLGPLIIGACISFEGYEKGIGILAIIYLLALLLFSIIALTDRKDKAHVTSG